MIFILIRFYAIYLITAQEIINYLNLFIIIRYLNEIFFQKFTFLIIINKIFD